MRRFHDHHGDVHASDWEDDPRDNDKYNPDDIEMTSIGIDIGSSTSHLLFSRLHLRRLGKYLSSRYVVVSREILYQSPILLTPYSAEYTIDANQLEAFIQKSFREAGFTSEDIDTGAVILTGEAVRRTNARAIGDLFASEAGKFVCASAGHNLEAVMAAHGSGAVEVSRASQRTVLNVDVGGGTAKLAIIQNGEVKETAAINVGGRLVALDDDGRVNRIEPAARDVADATGIQLSLHEPLADEDRQRLVDALADSLFALIRREPLSPLAKQLMLTPVLESDVTIDAVTFSGGVSEYIYDAEEGEFGDIARSLADAIRTRIEANMLPAPLEAAGNGIRATVLGASQFTVQVSSDTISISQPDLLPLRNLQVLHLNLPRDGVIPPEDIRAEIENSFRRFDLQEGEQMVALATDWNGAPYYEALRSLAEGFALGLPNTLSSDLPVVLVFASDVGKLVGDILKEEIGIENDVVSIDGIELKDFDFIDVGQILKPSYTVPTVIKSLVFPNGGVEARAELAV